MHPRGRGWPILAHEWFGKGLGPFESSSRPDKAIDELNAVLAFLRVRFRAALDVFWNERPIVFWRFTFGEGQASD